MPSTKLNAIAGPCHYRYPSNGLELGDNLTTRLDNPKKTHKLKRLGTIAIRGRPPADQVPWTPCVARNVCRLAPFRRPNPNATPGAIIGRFANSVSPAIPVLAARSYQ